MENVPLCALLLACSLACGRSALDDDFGHAILAGGSAASSTSATAAGGNDGSGGMIQGGTGIAGHTGQNLGGTGNVAGAAGAATRCEFNDFFGDLLLPTANYTGALPAQIATTSDVNGDQWPDVVLCQETRLDVFLAAGKGEFATRKEISYWYRMTSPVGADLNQDGYLDIVVVVLGSGLRAFMGQPDGVDSYASTVYTPSVNNPQLLAAGDLDANGAVDLVVSDGNTYVTAFTGTTLDRNFTASSIIALTSAIGILRVVDVNDDKVLDLLTLGTTAGIGTYFGRGDGTFGARVETAYIGTPTSLAQGFLNGDGYVDLLTADGVSMIKWLGRGDGTFAPLSSSGIAAVAAEVVDLDADGFSDIVAADATNGRLCVWPGSGDMISWPDPSCPTVIVDPYALGVADFDGDGTKDVVLASKTMQSLVVSWGGPERRRIAANRLLKQSVGAVPAALAVADVNADGILDVLTAPVDAAHLRPNLGTGNGQFANGGLVYTDSPPRALVTADFDNDGTLDMAAITASNALVISRRDEAIVASVPMGMPFNLMAVADLNNDGQKDLVLAEKGSTTGATLFGQGSNTFKWGKSFVSVRPVRDIAVGDLDGDRLPDLALATEPSLVEVAKGIGDGGFAESDLFSSGSGVRSMRIADLNEDEIPDLVTGSDDAGAFLLPGKGNLGFDYSTFIATGVPARDVVVADFDGDGHLDILASDLQSMVVGLALGKGDGTFHNHLEFLAGVIPLQLAVGDLNRDGRPDLVMSSQNSITFARLLNLCR